jgi:hypothetical protein
MRKKVIHESYMLNERNLGQTLPYFLPKPKTQGKLITYVHMFSFYPTVIDYLKAKHMTLYKREKAIT